MRKRLKEIWKRLKILFSADRNTHLQIKASAYTTKLYQDF